MSIVSNLAARFCAAVRPFMRPDAGRILRHAWSIRWIAAAAVLSGLEVGFTFFTDAPPLGIPRGTFSLAAAMTTVAAFGARFIAQRKFKDD